MVFDMKGAPFQVHEVEGGNPNVFGYARVSTAEQNLEAQLDQLQRAGCGRIVSEKISSQSVRYGWNRLVEGLRTGDCVVVVRLDRVGRKLDEIVRSVSELGQQGVHVRAIAQGIDTSQPHGSITLALFAALAETETRILSERTREGMKAARDRGARIGRPNVLDQTKRDLILHLSANGYLPSEIATAVKCGETTVRRALLEAATPPKQTKLELEEPPRAEIKATRKLSYPPRPRAKPKPLKQKRAAPIHGFKGKAPRAKPRAKAGKRGNS